MARVVIKIGTEQVLKDGNGVDSEFIGKVADQVAELMKKGHEFLIVSSGAVASDPKKYRTRNLRSMVGQPHVINVYREQFGRHGLEVAQMLGEDKHFLNEGNGGLTIFEQTMLEAFSEKIVVVANYLDGVSSEETDKMPECADNDNTAKAICLSPNLRIDYLMIITNVLGVLDLSGNVVPLVTRANFDEVVEYASSSSELGKKGGMRTKIQACHEFARIGKKAIIIPGKSKDYSIILGFIRLCTETNIVGTLFI